MIDVSAAILENKSGQVLIAKRKQGKKLAGYWEFPGGKVEEGESPEESLVRELKEEMNLDIEVHDFVGESIYRYAEGTIRLIAFKGRIIGGEIKLTDHDEYAWKHLHELSTVKLAPADIPLLNFLNTGGRRGCVN